MDNIFYFCKLKNKRGVGSRGFCGWILRDLVAPGNAKDAKCTRELAEEEAEKNMVSFKLPKELK